MTHHKTKVLTTCFLSCSSAQRIRCVIGEQRGYVVEIINRRYMR
jgi:hypothetical protein